MGLPSAELVDYHAPAGWPAIPVDAQPPPQVDRRGRTDAPHRRPAASRDDPGYRPGDRRQAPARRWGQSRPRCPQRPWGRQDRQGLQAARDLGEGRGPRGLVGRAAERLRDEGSRGGAGGGARPGRLSARRRRIRRHGGLRRRRCGRLPTGGAARGSERRARPPSAEPVSAPEHRIAEGRVRRGAVRGAAVDRASIRQRDIVRWRIGPAAGLGPKVVASLALDMG
jgi:hypothetical protein